MMDKLLKKISPVQGKAQRSLARTQPEFSSVSRWLHCVTLSNRVS